VARASKDISIIILIPAYNDWESLHILLSQLDQCLVGTGIRPSVVVIDDASSTEAPVSLGSRPYSAVERLEIIRLRRNLGHQRAISVGLVYVNQHYPEDAVVVMDGDGEDCPFDVIRLVQKYRELGEQTIVFAERTRRTESRLFLFLYKLYKAAHLVLTGFRVRVGNFSILPPEQVSSLVVISEIWNHYAAAVLNARLPHALLPTPRGRRYSGQSKMNVLNLTLHGLSAISVYGERVGLRLLVASCGLIVLTIIGVVIALILRFGTNLPIPDWTTYVTGVLVIIIFQCIMLSLFFVFITLTSRSRTTLLPLRDCPHYVKEVRCLFIADNAQ
jgi:glycosyltransferase involved in cell wall biosynthesis